MDKQFIIAGNWKMFKSVEESVQFVNAVHQKAAALDQVQLEPVEILVFPPFTSLYPVKGLSTIIKTGSQNLHYEDQGAFTGEISALMLKGIADYVLIGHSERREIFKETDEDIAKKVKTALNHGFTPVLCIGESLQEREEGKTFAKVEDQLNRDLEGLSTGDIQKLVIAYEPIWAIGTGKTATPEQAQEVHASIREILAKKINSQRGADTINILYGGSVKPQNSLDLLSQTDINGALIGGASLKVDDFFAIIQNSLKLTNQ
ncbi:MAG: triose-phosphate isomerase [bacterium]|nr:triose-phosphate isomerase [bacterium]